MATITIDSKPITQKPRRVRRVGFLTLLFAPILRRLLRTEQERLVFDGQIAAAREAIQRRKDRAKEIKRVNVEARRYASLIVQRWTQLGQRSDRRDNGITDNSRGRKKVHRVRWERIYTSAERVFLKIMVRKGGLFGIRNALPYGVRVGDLVHEETLAELQYSIERSVTQYNDPRHGAWIIVNRLEGIGGIPIMIPFRDLLDHMPEDLSKAPLLLGIGEHRKVHMVDLANYPHALIAGTTGGGKSNMVNALICYLIRFATHRELQLVLIDLKRMEFGFYEQIPHLRYPVIFDPEQALEVFEEMIQEIKNRASLLKTAGFKELSAWNKAHPNDPIPRIVVVVDEFAELMLASGKKVARATETMIARITNLGRAVGIHVIVCTQRPAVQVLPNTIKINMPLILAARVPTHAHSGVILGNGAAMELPADVPGRMVYQSGAQQQIIQTPYIRDEDVVETVRLVKGRAAGILTNDREPTINNIGLLSWIVRFFNGDLNLQRLYYALRSEYGIKKEMLKAFITDLRHTNGEIVTDEGTYTLHADVDRWWVSFTPADMVGKIIYLLPPPRPTEPEPEIVEVETTQEFDPIRDFLHQCCERSGDLRTQASVLHSAYLAYAQDRALELISGKQFGLEMKRLGIEKRKIGTNFYIGIGLRRDGGTTPEGTTPAVLEAV